VALRIKKKENIENIQQNKQNKLWLVWWFAAQVMNSEQNYLRL
jgi:hypothetical protein